MIEAVFLHTPEDRKEADACAAAWPGAGAVCAAVGAGAFTFGDSMLACGVWAGRAKNARSLAAALSPVRRRAILYALKPLPKELADLSLLVIPATADSGADLAALHKVYADMQIGVYPSAPPPPRKKKVRQPREKRLPPPSATRTASAEIDPAEEAERARRRRGFAGFAIGAVVGFAIFFGLAAPQIGAWLNRRDAPRPIVVAPRTISAPAQQGGVIAPPVAPPAAPFVQQPEAAPAPAAPLEGLDAGATR